MEALDLSELFGYGFWFSRSRDINLLSFWSPDADALQLVLRELVDNTVLTEARYITGWVAHDVLLRVIVEAIQDMESELTLQYKAHKRRATLHVR